MTEFSQLAKNAGRFLTDHSPTILTIIAVTGTVSTAYLTGRATVKAVEILEVDAQFREEEHYVEATPLEKVELVWQQYLPAIGAGIVTITAIVAGNQIGNRRVAALAAAYALSERAFERYREHVVEEVGHRKEQSYRDKIAQKSVTDNPPESSKTIVISGKSVLCYEAYTGRYFLSDMETLRRAENDINHQVNLYQYATLSDFYERVGLESTTHSGEVGWNGDKLLELQFSTVLATDGTPCISVDYHVKPVRDYHRLV